MIMYCPTGKLRKPPPPYPPPHAGEGRVGWGQGAAAWCIGVPVCGRCSSVGLKPACQVTPTVHDADDLDLVDRTLVSVGVCFKRYEIGPLDQHAHSRPKVTAARPKPGIMLKRIGLGFNRGVQPLRRCWIIEPDDDVNVEQVLPSLRTPDQLSDHHLALSWSLPAAFAPPVSPRRNQAALPGRWPCPRPTIAGGV